MKGAELARVLFSPESIVLVGTSNDLMKTAARPLQFIRRAGFAGRVFNVNPSRSEVQGEKSYSSISELPIVPDHAFILTSTEHAIEAVRECGKLGIPVATILASGFSESGEAGKAREELLREIAYANHIRLLGPSSIGLVNLWNNLTLTANAAFGEAGLPRGGIFCASHSGSLIGALTSRGRARGIGFHSLVSVGSETDLSIGEICEATLDDPTIDGYMLFLETTRNADSLRRFALAAAERGKPVVAYKLGRSEAAAELAVSHTGALAGEDDVADAFLRGCGIVRVDTFEGLLEALPLLKLMSTTVIQHRKPRVGVVTTTGGGAAMAVDQLGIRGVDVAPPSEETRRLLAHAGVEGGHGRILDLTLAGTRYEVMKGALDILLKAPEFDLILAVVGSSARNQPQLAVKPVIASMGVGQPLACFIVPDAPEALALLSEAGVPCFRTPESCGDVIAAAMKKQTPNWAMPGNISVGDSEQVMLNEAAAYGLFARYGIPHADFVVIDVSSPLPALPFAYPVVAKVLSTSISHKSDVGGVILDLKNNEELRSAIAAIRRNVESKVPGVEVGHVLVQRMENPVGEALIGIKRDNEIGPVIMVAAGGIYTEIYKDRSLRIAPVSLEVAREMIDEIRGFQTLKGYRNQPKGDLEALAQAVVAVSQLAISKDNPVLEAEINPMLVLTDGRGVIAVDALVTILGSS